MPVNRAPNGVGNSPQVWQSVTRLPATTYTNTTPRPIVLQWNIDSSSAASCTASASINGGPNILFSRINGLNGPCGTGGSIVIPPGATYNITEVQVTSRSVFELR